MQILENSDIQELTCHVYLCVAETYNKLSERPGCEIDVLRVTPQELFKLLLGGLLSDELLGNPRVPCFDRAFFRIWRNESDICISGCEIIAK